MSHKIYLPLDTKSLYYNIKNDNLKGHTCTVATPIKQGKSINNELNEVYRIPKQIDFQLSENLLNELTKNSKSVVRINNVFVFERIKVNNEVLNCEKSFCFFTKEEIDPNRVQYGRVKLHYPLSLKNDEFNIDNRLVINTISSFVFNYAFIVESFEYDLTDDYLNFNVLIVGYNGIPYSKVFINNKGVGSKYNKLVKNYFDIYDFEIIALRKKYGLVNPENFMDFIEKGSKIANELALKYLNSIEASQIRCIKDSYPYSIFDFQFYLNGHINYCILSFTFTKKKYFNLSYYQNAFLKTFSNSFLLLVSELDENNVISIIDKNNIETFSLSIDSIRFIGD